MTTLLLLLVALENPGFDNGLKGWIKANGAMRGSRGTAAAVAAAVVTADGGAARFVARTGDRRWPMLSQTVACAPGQRVLLTVRMKSDNVRHENDQYRNANAAVFFEGARGQRLGAAMTPLVFGTRDWIDLHCHALAPKGTKRARIVLILSMTGTLRFDDVRVEVARNTDAFACRALRLHFDRTYPFLDVRKPGKGGLEPMLRALGDLHVWIRTPRGEVPRGPRPRAPQNWNVATDRARLTKITLRTRRPSRRLDRHDRLHPRRELSCTGIRRTARKAASGPRGAARDPRRAAQRRRQRNARTPHRGAADRQADRLRQEPGARPDAPGLWVLAGSESRAHRHTACAARPPHLRAAGTAHCQLRRGIRDDDARARRCHYGRVADTGCPRSRRGKRRRSRPRAPDSPGPLTSLNSLDGHG